MSSNLACNEATPAEKRRRVERKQKKKKAKHHPAALQIHNTHPPHTHTYHICWMVRAARSWACRWFWAWAAFRSFTWGSTKRNGREGRIRVLMQITHTPRIGSLQTSCQSIFSASCWSRRSCASCCSRRFVLPWTHECWSFIPSPVPSNSALAPNQPVQIGREKSDVSLHAMRADLAAHSGTLRVGSARAKAAPGGRESEDGKQRSRK